MYIIGPFSHLPSFFEDKWRFAQLIFFRFPGHTLTFIFSCSFYRKRTWPPPESPDQPLDVLRHQHQQLQQWGVVPFLLQTGRWAVAVPNFVLFPIVVIVMNIQKWMRLKLFFKPLWYMMRMIFISIIIPFIYVQNLKNNYKWYIAIM